MTRGLAYDDTFGLIGGFDREDQIQWINQCLAEDTGKYPYICKTCSEKVKDTFRGRMKNGLFSLNQVQHDTLVAAEGCYVFIMEQQRGGCRFKVIPADRLNFQVQITWTRIFPQGG